MIVAILCHSSSVQCTNSCVLCTKSSGHGIHKDLHHALYVNWMVTACPVIIMEVEILAVLQALEVFLARGGSEILRVGRGYELPGVL